MQNDTTRSHLRIIRLILTDFLSWFFLLLTNWWPENIITCKIRGALVGLLFKSCGRNFQLGRNFRIIHPQEMCVGDNVYIAQDAWINAKGGLSLGNSVTIGPRCGLVTTYHNKVDGRGFAHKIGSGSHASISIGAGTWLAINVVIRHGITVGCGCIVAANAVVTKNVPDNVIVGGIPAKIIKQLDDNGPISDV